MKLSEWMFKVEQEKYNKSEETKVKLMKLIEHIKFSLQDQMIYEHETIIDLEGERNPRYQALEIYTECAELLITLQTMRTIDILDFDLEDSGELMNILEDSKHLI